MLQSTYLTLYYYFVILFQFFNASFIVSLHLLNYLNLTTCLESASVFLMLFHVSSLCLLFSVSSSICVFGLAAYVYFLFLTQLTLLDLIPTQFLYMSATSNRQIKPYVCCLSHTNIYLKLQIYLLQFESFRADFLSSLLN